MIEKNKDSFGICIEFRTKLWIDIFNFRLINMMRQEKILFPKILKKTRCRPSKGQRCIPDVIVKLNVKLIIVYEHDSRNFYLWHHGIKSNLVKLIRREQVERWTTSTWSTLLRYLYITWQCSLTNFSALLLPYFNGIQCFGFPCFSTSGNLSIDVSITNVELILTKPRWFQLFIKNKILISNF